MNQPLYKTFKRSATSLETFASTQDHDQALKQITKARSYAKAGRQLGAVGLSQLSLAIERAHQITSSNNKNDQTMKPKTKIQERLEQLRAELRAERMSYGELHELQSLAKHIQPDDVELLEAAGAEEEIRGIKK